MIGEGDGLRLFEDCWCWSAMRWSATSGQVANLRFER